MSIQSEIDRIAQNVANTYAVLSALGADMPVEQNSDNLVATAGAAKAVLYSEQSLTDEQKAQARENIGVPDVITVTVDGSWNTSHSAVEIITAKNAGKIVILNCGIILAEVATAGPDATDYVDFYTVLSADTRLMKLRVRVTGNQAAPTFMTLDSEAIGLSADEIATVLGYTPADAEDVSSLSAEKMDKIPVATYEQGQYDIAAYVKNGKIALVPVPDASTTKLYPIDVSVGETLSINDLFYVTQQFAQGGQDGTFIDGRLFRINSTGTVYVTDISTGSVLQTMALDKSDVLMPHANSVTVKTGDPETVDLEFVFETGSYDSSSGQPTANDRTRTGILNLALLDNIVFSITNKQFIVSCYDAVGGYLGQLSTALNGLTKGSGQWLSQGTVISQTLLHSVSSEITQIAIIGQSPEERVATTYTATYNTSSRRLYANVYNNYSDEEDKHIGECCVYSVQRNGENYSNSLAQVIKIGFINDLNLWISLGDARPYGNFVVDNENSKLYVYVAGWTGLGGVRETRWFEFNLPEPTSGVFNADYGCPVVTLSSNDIVQRWTTKPIHYMQGACCFGGKLWCSAGFGTSSERAMIHVIDIEKQTQIAELDLNAANMAVEPEFIDFYDNKLYYGDFSHVYTITLC